MSVNIDIIITHYHQSALSILALDIFHEMYLLMIVYPINLIKILIII